ncbi:MAG: lipopolysaccharide assembly LapA domain-containing protein [Anaerolineales bacterium]
MRIFFAIALILALLATVFAVQNIKDVTISFLFWSIEGSLALVLMITLVLGIAIGVLLMAPGSVRNRLQVGGLQRTVRSLEDEKEASVATATVPETPQLEAERGGSPEDK